MEIIIHYPKTLEGWHSLAAHAAAVSELIELDRQGKLVGPLGVRIHQLTPEDEEEAWERQIRKMIKSSRRRQVR